MFTGIVEEIGSVRRTELRSGGLRIDVEGSAVLEGTRPGDSISVNGVCLTVEKVTGSVFTAFLSSETMEKTTLGDAVIGFRVNLERALVLGGRLGGHLVSGHVETKGQIRELRKDGEAYHLVISCPSEFAPYVVPKGSVSVDGVSLTIVEGMGEVFSVAMIPETFEKTTFRLKTPGNFVNLEPDLILKYVMSVVRNLTAEASSETITIDKLIEAGFIAD
ncbi:MAG: riboflavin synthase [bacterium]|nr:riboflavin synthase [bacterium]MDT8364869.1 riboflavin synthase [bacterium]